MRFCKKMYDYGDGGKAGFRYKSFRRVARAALSGMPAKKAGHGEGNG